MATAGDGPDPQELAAALTAAGVGEVDTSRRRRVEYSSDASLYRVLPAVVAFPRDTDEVEATLSVCRSLHVPLTPRGAGTSIAGNAVGRGVVLDFSRHLNRPRDVDPEARTARIGPGVVLDHLQHAASRFGLRFGPDPSTHSRATLGGMIGNNACGSRTLGYGRTADNVIALDLLAGNGERLVAGRDQAPGPESATLRAVHDLVANRLELIRTEFGRFSRQVSGYSLEHLLPENRFNVAAALVGTEGSCGVLMEATVRLVEIPSQTLLLALGYPDMAQAADAVPAVLPHDPTAVEGLDARIVDAVRNRRGPCAVPLLPRGDGWLFVELTGTSAGELVSRAGRVAAGAGALQARLITEPAEAAALWRIREDGAGLVAVADPSRPAQAGWEDAAVPPDRLGDYLRDFEDLLAGHALSGVPYGHFGDGCLHVRIDFPLHRPGGTAVFASFLADAARLVTRYGGSVSGEHGDGRARSALLPLMYSPAALEAFAAMKRVFDPDGVLNPGIVVNPATVDADLRAPVARTLRSRLGLAYRADAGDLPAAVHRCTGVGRCRDAAVPTPAAVPVTGSASGPVMCPSYRATGDEKDSTRARARVLQELARGTLPGGWRSPALRESLDLCLSCKGCATDCPTGIDIAACRTEWLYQRYRHRPRPPAHYVLGDLPHWVRLAARMPRLANLLLGASRPAAAGKRLAGIDSRRDLPRLAPATFRQQFARHPPPRCAGDLANRHHRARDRAAGREQGTGPSAPNRRPVMLFVDCFTDHFTPQVGLAAVRLLRDAGFAVSLSPPQLCCGLTWISTGRLDTARRILRRTMQSLAATGNVPILALEPSCAAVLRRDAEEVLSGTPSAVAATSVAARVRTLAELLCDHPGWRPPNLSGTTVVAQPHCHHHAVMGWQADRDLLTRTGAEVETAGGCCGMAGTFGIARGHYDVSVAVAETALLPAVRRHPDAAVLADGFSCRTQLEQLAGRTGLHLAEFLLTEVPNPPGTSHNRNGSPDHR